MSDAPWLCTSCHTNNHAETTTCRRCQRPTARAGGQQSRVQHSGQQQSRRPYDPHPMAPQAPGTAQPIPPDPTSVPYPDTWNGYSTAPPAGSSGPYGSPSAHSGNFSAAAYVAAVVLMVIVLAVAVVWQSSTPGSTDQARQLPSSTTTTEEPATTSAPEAAVTTPPTTAAFQQVSGPLGLTLAIPSGWQPRNGPVEGNYQADDPSDPGIFLRFGGTERPGNSVIDYLLGGERGNPNIQPGYQRLRLTAVSYLGSEAADWEFLFDKDGVQRHAYGRYWYSNGAMYVIYGSAPADQWGQIEPILQVALDSAAIP